MTIVDERGRLFGRFNLIDAGIAVAALVLVPLVYAAYLLFRPPAMKILSVEPSRLDQGQQPRVRIHGANLRPYLRAQVGHEQPHIFLIQTPTDAEFAMPALPPGTYDLTLYDEVQEVARLKNAITVSAPPAGPRVRVRAIGAFFNLDEAAARGITSGRKFPNDAGAIVEVVGVAEPSEDVRRLRPVVGSESIVLVPVPGSWQVPATIRVVCQQDAQHQNCNVNEVPLSPGTTLAVPGGFSFVIDEVRADAPGAPVIARVQFSGRPEVIESIAAGDVDAFNPVDAPRILSVRNRQTVAGQLSRQVVGFPGIVETASTPERFATVDADVALTADRMQTGFVYRSMPIKPGAPLTFETLRYVVRGTILAVTPSLGGSTK
jgi:Domain of unknown function (DUF4330)